MPAGAIVSEYGAGQFEVNLHHVKDALAACDHAILLRRLVRGIARQQGLAATFMAKPFRDLDGSGMHVHFSLLDGSGRNVFGPAPPAATPDAYPDTLRHAVGGMLSMLPESLAIFAPNANSYRRFRPGFFVPIAPNWGPNHRQVALRIPTSDDANVRLEHRVAGADCNPYLAMAAILAAAHAGITRRIEPPPMIREGEPVGLPIGSFAPLGIGARRLRRQRPLAGLPGRRVLPRLQRRAPLRGGGLPRGGAGARLRVVPRGRLSRPDPDFPRPGSAA